MRVALLGFGLIGGSIAKALRFRDPGRWDVVAWSPTGAGPRQALREGVVVAAAADPVEAMAGAELIVLAAPPSACLSLLDDLAGPLTDAASGGAVLTDVASTKAAIVARAADHGLPFVGGHPMAGSDRDGFGAADPALFVDRPWVLVPPAKEASEPVARVERLVRAVGAHAIEMDAAEHDAAAAAISHLPLVTAAALVEAVTGGRDWPSARVLAASGWRDATRLARGDVDMGAGILATNAGAVAGRLRDLRAALDEWIALLEAPGGLDEAEAAARLRRAQERLDG